MFLTPFLPQFWKRFNALPREVQQLARKNLNLLKQDSRHPTLQFKRLGDYWSARVGLNHRALAVEDGSDWVWVWIGTHAQYDKLIK
jgi:hypothetical protein